MAKATPTEIFGGGKVPEAPTVESSQIITSTEPVVSSTPVEIFGQGRASVKSPTEQLKEQVGDKMLPYVNLSTGSVDVIRAARAGVNPRIIGKVIGEDVYESIINPSQTAIDKMFAEGKKAGTIPNNAILKGYKDFSLEYEIPAPADTRTGQQVLDDLVASGEITELNPVLKSYDKATGRVEYEYEAPAVAQIVLPVGFIGSVATNEVRAETLFAQLQKEKPELAGAVLKSYDNKTGEFSYEIPAVPKPLTGEIGATFLGGARISIPVSEDMENTLNTVAGFLQVFGGATDAEGRTLQEQVKYTDELPAVNLISRDLRESLLRIGNMVSVVAPRTERDIYKEPLSVAVDALYLGSLFIPFIGSTIYTLVEKPNPILVGLNYAIDAAVMFPWLKAGVRAAASSVKKASDPAGFAVNQMIRQESKLATATTSIIRKTLGDQAADSFTTLYKAQTEYAEQLTRLIKTGGKKATAAVVKVDKAIEAANVELRQAGATQNFTRMKQLENTIKDLKAHRAVIDPVSIAQTRAAQSAAKLEQAADNYKNIIKKSGAGFDDGLVSASLDEMPKMIVRNTETAVKDTISKATTNVRSLRKALTQAESRLTSVQQTSAASDTKIKSLYDAWQRAGGGPGTVESRSWVQAVKDGKQVDKKLADALYSQVVAQKRLEQAAARSASELGIKLGQKRTELAQAQKQLRRAEAIEKGGGHTEPPAYDLRDKVKRLQSEVYKLTDEYTTAVKKMETEIRVKYEKGKGYYAEPEGLGGGGRGGVAVAAPSELSPSMIAALRQSGRAAPRVAGGAAAVRGAPRVAPNLVDAVAATTLGTIKASWKVGDAEVPAIETVIREAITTTTAPMIREVISPSEAAAMTPDAIKAIEEAIQSSIQAAIKAAAEGKTDTEIMAATSAAIQESIESATEPATRAELQTRTKAMTKLATQTATATLTKLRRIKTPPIKGKFTPHIVFPEGGVDTDRKPIPEGSLTWAQGIKWKYIPAPWSENKPRTLNKAPQGASNPTGTKPEATLQVIGKRPYKVPKDFSIDLGVVDAFITNYGKTIDFAGHGTKTDVGKRLASPTKGMSVAAIRPTEQVELVPEDEELSTDLYPDEDPNWLASTDVETVRSRVKPLFKKKRAVRRNNTIIPTSMGGVRRV